MTHLSPQTAAGWVEAAPDVSFVIPAFNAAATLERTLLSLQRQGVTEWEAVIVDDGSTDATALVAARARDTDSRVRLVSQRNQGVSVARNAGIALARGAWLVFLDADDWIAPDYPARMHAALQADPDAGAVCCGYARTDSQGSQLLRRYPPAFGDEPFACAAQHAMGCIHAFMIRRSLVLAVGGFDPGLRTCEDWDLHQRVFRTGARLVQVPDILAFYAGRPGSLSRDGARMLRDARTVLQRGAAADPRVPAPDARYANGLPPAEPIEYLCLWIACWCMAIAIGSDGEIPDLLAEIRDFSYTAYFGATIFEGLIIGSGLPPASLAARWDHFAAPVGRLVDDLASRAGDPGRARAIFDELAWLIVEAGAPPSPVVVGSTLIARVRPVMLWRGLTVPAGVDSVFLLAGPRRGIVQLGVLGALTGSDIRAALAGAVGERVRGLAVRVLRHRMLGRSRLFGPAQAVARQTLAMLNAPAGVRMPLSPRARSNAARIAALIDQERAAAAEAALPAPAAWRTADTAPGPAPDDACPGGTRRVPILMYHVIGAAPGGGAGRFHLPPARFEQQLRFLRRRGFHSVGLDEWCRVARRAGRFADRPIMLTFDDATEDFLYNAWPILDRNGFSANVFVPTGKVGGLADWSQTGPSPDRLMGWDQIVALSRQGVEFGSHLVSHTATNWMSTEHLVRESARSRATLEQRLGRPIHTVALPYGVTSQRVSRVLRACGYVTAMTTVDAVACTLGRMMEVPRIEIAGDDDMPAFARKLGCDSDPPDRIEDVPGPPAA